VLSYPSATDALPGPCPCRPERCGFIQAQDQPQPFTAKTQAMQANVRQEYPRVGGA